MQALKHNLIILFKHEKYYSESSVRQKKNLRLVETYIYRYIKGEINHRMLSMQWNSVNFVIIVSSKLKNVLLENVRNNYLMLNNYLNRLF